MLDVRLQGTSGLDFQIDLAAAGINLPVVFITGHGDIAMSVRAMKAGAVDFSDQTLSRTGPDRRRVAAHARDKQRREAQRGMPMNYVVVTRR